MTTVEFDGNGLETESATQGSSRTVVAASCDWRERRRRCPRGRAIVTRVPIRTLTMVCLALFNNRHDLLSAKYHDGETDLDR